MWMTHRQWSCLNWETMTFWNPQCYEFASKPAGCLPCRETFSLLYCQEWQIWTLPQREILFLPSKVVCYTDGFGRRVCESLWKLSLELFYCNGTNCCSTFKCIQWNLKVIVISHPSSLLIFTGLKFLIILPSENCGNILLIPY